MGDPPRFIRDPGCWTRLAGGSPSASTNPSTVGAAGHPVPDNQAPQQRRQQQQQLTERMGRSVDRTRPSVYVCPAVSTEGSDWWLGHIMAEEMTWATRLVIAPIRSCDRLRVTRRVATVPRRAWPRADKVGRHEQAAPAPPFS